ncbi:MAG: sulfotransferase [Sphingomonadaceae bacterium]
MDAAAQYRIHKAMLQALQYGREDKYWVLKGFHTTRLKEFFDAYPDASLVWLHRDPVMVAASSTMMMSDIMEGIVGKIDLVAEAKMHLERVRWSVGNTMSNPLTDDPRIHHVRYKDFVADPIATIRYYEFAGREYGERQEAAMREYLANNKGDRHGKFHYSTQVLVDAGYDIDELNEIPPVPRALRCAGRGGEVSATSILPTREWQRAALTEGLLGAAQAPPPPSAVPSPDGGGTGA